VHSHCELLNPASAIAALFQLGWDLAGWSAALTSFSGRGASAVGLVHRMEARVQSRNTLGV
jgi:hypothetical protein